MEVFLLLNGLELQSTVHEQERLMIDLAAGLVSRDQLVAWLEQHVRLASS